MEEDLQIQSQPLAERMRPATLEEFVGQEHLLGPGGVIRRMLESGNISSFILWGPPGCGKTTLANIIARNLGRDFYTLSAVSSGVKEVRDVIAKASGGRMFNVHGAPILFIDEIHRFNKGQQDALLAAVENGTVVLIGATTENPSFEVISPLLSRCRVYVFKSLEVKDLDILMRRALERDVYLKSLNVKVLETEALFRYSGGDGRKLLGILELVCTGAASASKGGVEIDNRLVTDILQENIALYDKDGEQHYDIISAFIKSMRGSDPNGAIYWLARMLAGGEDPLFIARRMLILASEDVGLANPNAALLAESCFNAVHQIGMPEARIILAETCIYLATSPKSNSAYKAIDAALAAVKGSAPLPVPLHLRNAPTKLMQDLGYAKDYKYAHAYQGNFVQQEFLPDEISGTSFYEPGDNTKENAIGERMRSLWGDKYKF